MFKTITDYILLVVVPSWKPLLLGVAVLVAVGIASNVFAARGSQYYGLDRSIAYVGSSSGSSETTRQLS